MSVRRSITDIMGRELYPGDLVAYPSRQGNRVRQSVAVVRKTYAKKVDGRLLPMMKVAPGVADSGFTSRRSLREEHVSTEHCVLVERGDL